MKFSEKTEEYLAQLVDLMGHPTETGVIEQIIKESAQLRTIMSNGGVLYAKYPDGISERLVFVAR